MHSLQSTIAPIVGQVPPADLTADDIQYLSGETGLQASQLGHYTTAAQSAAKTQVAPEIFYGFARQRLPTSLNRLLATDQTVQRQVLQAAAAQNVIPPSVAGQIEGAVATLKQTAISETLTPGAYRLGGTLTVSLADPNLQKSFLNTFLDNKQSSEKFWQALAQQPGFTPDLIASTQFGVQLASLTQYHPPLVTALLNQYKPGQLSDLARLDTPDWLKLINSNGAQGAPIGIPPGVPGNNAQEMAQNYAEALTRRLEVAFPSVAFSARLAKTALPGAAEISAFLDANPDFNIAATNAVEYAALKKAPDIVVQHLPAWQRIFKVAPRFDQMQPLYQAGLTSARSIARMPLALFTTTFSAALGGDSETQSIYARSQLFAHSAVQLYGKYAGGLGHSPIILPQSPNSPQQIPNWTNLFGTLDYCACTDSRSVLSPAAYLVDLLFNFVDAFITGAGGTKGTTLLFQQRRPDINTLQLSCENTNTTLPAIDLVNELLEDAASPGTAQPHDTTDGSPDDLAALPEYLNQGAYTLLAQQVFPWNLPFDLGLSQARAYLQNIPLQRYALMEAFQTSPTAPDPTDNALTNADAVVADFLNLSPLGWKIVAGVSGQQPWTLWGVAQADWQNTWTVAAPGPTVQQFQTQSGLDFQDLQDLLTTRYVQSLAPPPNQILIQWNDSPNSESCDTSAAHILNLTAPALNGILQFLRLRQALGVSVLDLDKLVTALQTGAFNAALLQQIVAAARLQNNLNLSWSELSAWWGPIPTLPDVSGGTSLYQRLFLNPALVSLVKPLDTTFALNAAGTELADTTHFLEEAAHQPTVLGGLQIASADLASLLNALPLAAAGGQHTLNLANLSELFRFTSLARALTLSVSDALTLTTLLSLDLALNHAGPQRNPFRNSQVADAAWVFSQSTFIQSSGFTLAELNYLLLDGNPTTSSLAPAPADLAQQLTNLCAGLQPIFAKTGGTDPAWHTLGGALVEQQLSTWLSIPVAALAQWLTNTPPAFAETYLDTFLDPAFVKTVPPVTTAAVNTALQAPVPANPAAAPPLYYQTRALIKLKKLSVFFKRLNLQTAELAWLSSNAATVTFLDLNQLPAFAAAPPPLYLSWAKLVLISQLRTQFTPGQPFYQLIPPLPPAPLPAEPDYLNALAALASWDPASLQTLAGAGGLNLACPNDFRDPATLSRLNAAFQMLTSLGANASLVLPWTHAVLTFSQASDITGFIKGKFTTAAWPAIGQTLRAPLRQMQRDALVSYLIFNSQAVFNQAFSTPDDLFGYFLTDTQVSFCMLTSRLIQATQSVQTFIQRCLMNLESNVTVAQPAPHYWVWMKQYRLWQANREIFLYPENWIDETLRDDQTDFFKTLASALHRSEVTQDAVEAAFLDYLTSLDGVARLQVCGIYHEVDQSNSIDILHVFAKTQGTPLLYYYRQFVNSSYWTQWEKVDLDIPGCDVVPVVFNRRVYLIWPISKAISASPSQMSAPNPGESNFSPTPTPSWVQIQIAWSQYTQNKWTAKKTSDAPGLLVPVYPNYLGRNLVPAANEAHFDSPYNCMRAEVILSDGSVDPSWFSFKAIPPSASDNLDQLQVECYVRALGVPK